MSGIATAIVGSAVVSGVVASKSAKKAANAQTAAAEMGVEEQRYQFDALQKLLKPYAAAGNGALGAQQDLLGLNGIGKQRGAISGIENGAQFQALLQQGEDAILQNASATGGLRGGDVQSALGQFRPQLLSALIDQQYSRLGGITSIGQNAAAMTGNAGMQAGNSIAGLMQQSGAAQAGAALAQGNAIGSIANGATGAFGMYSAMNRPATATTGAYAPSTMPATDYSLGTASLGGF